MPGAARASAAGQPKLLRRWSAGLIVVLLAAAVGRHRVAEWTGAALDSLSRATGSGRQEATDAAAAATKASLSGVLGHRGALIFGGLDEDGDGRLTAAEFAPVVETLTGEDPQTLRDRRGAESGGSALVLTASFTPLDYKSLKIVQDEGLEGLMRNVKNLKGLTAWRRPAQLQQEFVASEFRPFSPVLAVPLGKAYHIYKPDVDVSWRGTNTRYYPPVPAANNERVLFKLLKMLHPRPFVLTRFGPYGSAAVVQAENERYYSIAFRIHAEFQLNEPPLYPFWYSPAQFSGDLVIAKDSSNVVQFHMSVPSDRLLNVDMEWVTEIDAETKHERMEVEIGYMPRMEVAWNGSSSELAAELRWRTQISKEQAASALERLLYPFKKVDYLPLIDALDRALEQRKLVHSIILWGSLDDQSC